MHVEPLSPLTELVYSDQGCENKMQDVIDHMNQLPLGSHEAIFDSLILNREKEELKVRKSHHLDPGADSDPTQIKADQEQLDELLAQDQQCQMDLKLTTEWTLKFPTESYKWGIPMGHWSHSFSV